MILILILILIHNHPYPPRLPPSWIRTLAARGELDVEQDVEQKIAIAPPQQTTVRTHRLMIPIARFVE